MRVVLDTNIFISGIFWEGNFSSQIINLWRKQLIEVVSSRPLIEELEKTLKTFKINMDYETISFWKNILLENAVIVNPLQKIEVVKDDPDDNKFLEAAVEGNAEYIVTQD